ncbi:hypothetical protein VTJ83DRAFT_6121 [Remersonia thermophila]|uniref:T6SS Phospholipase effector Tle1-like catalytic domain-containing protein n=1 Tax=Remersonia thermophila TaxID=72144 RepID=A0ABR4D8S6_9PEZI
MEHSHERGMRGAMDGHGLTIKRALEAHLDHQAPASTPLPSRPATPMEPDQVTPSPAGPQPKPRNMVLCFDGTGNKFHGTESDSNILKIFRLLDRTASDQYHYYQPGIGTYVVSNDLTRKGIRARIKSQYTKAKDSAIGSSFDQHVVGGYRFLMRYYNPGDQIYIFGFSRGAYVARFLAEMLDYIGLLSHGNEEMVIFAWKAFANWQIRKGDRSPEGIRKTREMYAFMKGFRETFARPIERIRFLGLFDTVNSVPRFESAWMERSKFPYTARTTAKIIRHAVSIDERRAKFRQDLIYQRGCRKEKGDKTSKKGAGAAPILDMPKKHDQENDGLGAGPENEGVGHAPYRPRPDNLAVPTSGEAPYRSRPASLRSVHSGRTTGSSAAHPSQGAEDAPLGTCALPHAHNDNASIAPTTHSDDEDDQDIDEVWFAGSHADVGGGWEVDLDKGKPASHVPLVWMVQEAMEAGLKFDLAKVREMGCAEAPWDLERESGLSTVHGYSGSSAVTPTVAAANEAPSIPGIMVRSDTMSTPIMLRTGQSSSDSESPRQSTFRNIMHQAGTARLHDSLEFGGGLPAMSVLAWKIMEYLPFRRMDLQPDNTWKPIRWPLPRGEVRDMPRDARVHGSVLRRLQSDPKYRPGNLIIGGGGRGMRVAPKEAGIGEWVCVEHRGCPVREIWVRKDAVEGKGIGCK